MRRCATELKFVGTYDTARKNVKQPGRDRWVAASEHEFG
jgi:hypothetical protein